MRKRLGQKMMIISVFVFLLTYFSPLSWPEKETLLQSDITELIRAGKELYENGDYKEAIIMFLTILTKTQAADEVSEIYFNLSLSYFADGQSEKAEEYLRKLFEIRPDKTIDERYFPLSFVELFNRLKPEPKPVPEIKTKTKPPIKPEPEKKPPPETKPEPKKKLETETVPERKTEPELKIESKEEKDTPKTVKEADVVPLSLVDVPPEPIKKVFPQYSSAAKRMGIEGTVIINALISEKGDVISTAILKGIEGPFRLNEAAQQAVMKWKFKPAIKDSKPVKVWKPIAIRFSVKKNQ
jgi:TonB family protein